MRGRQRATTRKRSRTSEAGPGTRPAKRTSAPKSRYIDHGARPAGRFAASSGSVRWKGPGAPWPCRVPASAMPSEATICPATAARLLVTTRSPKSQRGSVAGIAGQDAHPTTAGWSTLGLRLVWTRIQPLASAPRPVTGIEGSWPSGVVALAGRAKPARRAGWTHISTTSRPARILSSSGVLSAITLSLSTITMR
jgi:hypothetical protein